MKPILTIFTALLISFTIFSNSATAQNTASLSISGEVTTPITLTKEDLKKNKQVSHTVKDRDGKEHEFTGVPLITLLENAGTTTGTELRGENLTKYLLVQAADGYEVVFSLAEIDPEFTNQVVLLATEKDGKPLPAGEGPFRLIVPNDKKQARWIREVRSMKVIFAK